MWEQGEKAYGGSSSFTWLTVRGTVPTTSWPSSASDRTTVCTRQQWCRALLWLSCFPRTTANRTQPFVAEPSVHRKRSSRRALHERPYAVFGELILWSEWYGEPKQRFWVYSWKCAESNYCTPILCPIVKKQVVKKFKDIHIQGGGGRSLPVRSPAL